MSRLDQLRHIAGLVGIGTSYVDALGVVREPDEETLARLITGFGLPDEPDQAAAALAGEAQAAPFGLPPLQIVGEEEAAPVLRLRLTAEDRVEWHCRFEAGGEAAGQSDGAELRLPDGLPLGYHRLAIDGGGAVAELDLVVAPPSCHLGPGLEAGDKSWGLTTQLYGMRSSRDWGIGDFTDLAALCCEAGGRGASAIRINPPHALIAAEPRHFSPYSPSSRLWLDYLYLDVTAIPGFAEDEEAQATAPAAAPQTGLVDYAAVAALKRPILERLYRDFQVRHHTDKLADDFRRFCENGGDALRLFATFEALHEHFLEQGGPFSWHDWPPAMRDPQSAEVAEFARAQAERIGFFQFLQWQADQQLGAAARAGKAAGLALGLYRDIAVGVNPNGAEAWADQELVMPGMAIGAPPDILARTGQNWGLAPFNPLTLRRQGFAPFIAALRANMRHAGILRIDHVMGLQRLYWVPGGMPATRGAYVNYPFRELLRLVALESRRQDCAVVGEDLGTVPEGFREAMQRANVLSYRVFVFQRRADGNFLSPREYPELAAASAATHDLATLKGYWLGRDIEWRRRLGAYPDDAAAETEASERFSGRYQLLEALAREGLLPAERFGEFLSAGGEPTYTPELGLAIHAFLARSAARLMLVQLEDVVGEVEQANLPGTTDAHPNWRRRLAEPIEAVLAGPAMARLVALLATERGRTGSG